MIDPRARCDELLVDRATNDLSSAGRRELDEILLQHPEWNHDDLELAAAALDVALQSGHEVMPDTVKQRLRNDARGCR